MKPKYLYAVRNKSTGKIQSAKCGKSGKYYELERFAKERASKFNRQGYGADHDRGEFEVVKYALIEMKHDDSKYVPEYYAVSTELFGKVPCENCLCNPKNGGSGICNCTLANSKIT